MRIVVVVVLLLLSASALPAESQEATRQAALQAAAVACGALPVAEQEACLESAFGPTPEQAARLAAAAHATQVYYTRSARALAASGTPRDLAICSR